MIQKLRKQFILVAMCSTLAVLSVIIGAMNILYYQRIITNADSLLYFLAENDARFPDNLYQSKKEVQQEIQKFQDMPKKFRHPITAETPYETRFFSVRLAEDGEVILVDTGRITAVKTKDAISFAQSVIETGKETGFQDNYRYLFTSKNYGSLVIFVDISRELSSFRTILYTSIIVSVLGILAVFILVLFFSKIVFRPVADSYAKQKQFITDASHELKTPLTIISANIEVLEMESEENNWTVSIKKQIDRMIHLVEQMVSLSKMDEEQVVINKEQLNFSEIVKDMAQSFEPVALQQNKKFDNHIEENITVIGDEKLLRQMLSLLLENAVKYSNEEGKISLDCRKKGSKTQLTIWNSVEEIQKGNLAVLFERFYRLDSSRNSEKGGSGIGLSIVKSIVDAHKGKISANSEDGKSLEISVIL